MTEHAQDLPPEEHGAGEPEGEAERGALARFGALRDRIAGAPPGTDPRALVREVLDADRKARRVRDVRTGADVVRDMNRAIDEAQAAEDAGEDAGAVLGRALEAVDTWARMATRTATMALADGRPQPVIRGAGRGGAVLSQGTVGLLTGGGGGGKTSLVCALALAAHPDVSESGDAFPGGLEPTPWNFGTAAGLDVRTGPVVLLSFEDSAGKLAQVARVCARALHADAENAERLLDNLHLVDARSMRPLFAPVESDDGRSFTNSFPEPTQSWAALWDVVDEVGVHAGAPPLVVLDPLAAAVMGDQNAWHVARQVMRECARRAEDHEVGLLLVHHANKSGKRRVSSTGEPHVVDDVDLAGGASAWIDAARGALALAPRKGRTAELRCIKANDGPVHWSVHLVGEGDAWPAWRPETADERADRAAAAQKGQPAPGSEESTVCTGGPLLTACAGRGRKSRGALRCKACAQAEAKWSGRAPAPAAKAEKELL